MLSGVGGMTKSFQLIDNALIDVRDKVSSKVKHIA
jgi:hypothetical protein